MTHYRKALYRLLFTSLLLTGCTQLSGVIESGSQLGNMIPGQTPSLEKGIKELLTLSSTKATQHLAQTNAYLENSQYKIQLPTELDEVVSLVRRFGYGSKVDEIEQLMNRGAEQAAQQAETIFVQTIKTMSIDDALSIINGPQNSATVYLRTNSYNALAEQYAPIIQSNLDSIGFYGEFEKLLDLYNSIPLTNKPSLDPKNHVLRKSLDGLFQQMAKEETKIRSDPIGEGNKIIRALINSQN